MTTRGCLATDAGSGGGGGGGGGGTPGTIVLTTLDSADLTTANESNVPGQSVITGNFTSTIGRAMYVFCEGVQAGGVPLPTVTFDPLGTPQVLTWLNLRGQPTTSQKNTFLFGFIPTAGATAPIKIDFGLGVTSTEFVWTVFEATGVDTTGGIAGTLIPDSTFTTGSLANNTTATYTAQTAAHANNVNVALIQLGTGGGSAGTLAPAAGLTKLRYQGTDLVTTTLGVAYSAAGGKVNPGWSWTTSFSNICMTFELKAANTTTPGISCALLGQIHSTTVATTITIPSVTVASGTDKFWLLAVASYRATAVADPTSIAGTLSATWVAQGSALPFNSVGTPTTRLMLYKSTNATGSGTVIPTWGANQDGGSAILVEVAGCTTSGQVVQDVAASHDATDTAPTAAMAAFSNTNNGTLMFIAGDPSATLWITNSGGVGMPLVENDYTATTDDARAMGRFATPNGGLAAIWCHSNKANPAATSTGATVWGARSLELKAA